MARQVIANLDKAVADLPCRVLGLYWPIKREIDLLKWAASLSETRGIALALPVVSIPRSPLEYWLWQPGARMARGFWNIPVPVEKKPIDPDVVIAPLWGFTIAGGSVTEGDISTALWRRARRAPPQLASDLILPKFPISHPRITIFR